jgi:hypothetical protein
MKIFLHVSIDILLFLTGGQFLIDLVYNNKNIKLELQEKRALKSILPSRYHDNTYERDVNLVMYICLYSEKMLFDMRESTLIYALAQSNGIHHKVFFNEVWEELTALNQEYSKKMISKKVDKYVEFYKVNQ